MGTAMKPELFMPVNSTTAQPERSPLETTVLHRVPAVLSITPWPCGSEEAVRTFCWVNNGKG